MAGLPACSATVATREAAVLCGRPWFDASFRLVDPAAEMRIDWLFAEGDEIRPGDRVCVVAGAPGPLLTAERTALNFLQLLSGTATAARRFAAAAAGALVLDTRKTVPGLRAAQKYAVRVGGAANQRMGLHDGILLKENHAAACGGLTALLRRAAQAGVIGECQVEVRSLDEAREAISCGARRILLDNFTPEAAAMAAAVAARTPDAELEVSGNVTLENIADYAAGGVARISVGALTKHARAIDFSLQIRGA